MNNRRRVAIFTPDWDLTLVVGHPNPREFLVSSEILANSSRFFEALLHGGWAESKPSTGEWRVPFPDDNQRSMRLLLAIIHSKNDVVPTRIGVQKLYNLLVTTNKYDMTHHLRPWARTWLEPLKADLFDDGKVTKIAVIAWELGCVKTFREAIRDVALNSTIITEGDRSVLCDPAYHRLAGCYHPGPLDLRALVGDHRQRVIDKHMEIFDELHDWLFKVGCKDRKKVTKQKTRCQQARILKFQRSLVDLGIKEHLVGTWHDPKSKKRWDGSVTDLTDKFLQILLDDSSERECSPMREYQQRFFDAEGLEVQLSEHQLRALEAKAVKTGV